MRIRMITARKTVLRRALAWLICLGILRSSHGQAFTIPGLSDLPALPGLATGLVNSITSGTKPGSVKPIGTSGFAVVTVNPYGCNAPAVPLQSWNIDLAQVYVLRGISFDALTIPTEGVNLEVRAAKTTAELSTWSGSNPLCVAFKLTPDKFNTIVNCTQPMAARYMTIADVDGDNLPVCAMNALVGIPASPSFSPAAVPASAPSAGGSSTWFPPLAPAGAQQALAPVQAGGRQGSAARAPQAGQMTPADASQGQTQWDTPNSQNGLPQLGDSSRQWRPAYSGGGGGGTYGPPETPEGPAVGSGGYTLANGVPMRPLLPSEGSSSSLSSTVSQASSSGEGSGIVLTNGAVIGIAVGAFAVISIIIGAVTYHIIRKEEAELVMGKKMPL
ncbi:hypothetical protein COCSUDRAFT_64673 [Coccomyxa subellipsoidea C-169]|uniref:Uncharacterized protein n=1 Tax=Coccomyxa subellipsoidea (strain C-169) TaxID=574566 RepID=I0Z857_COCSC|nr:hypothetical protein COCSUDRAFT_64673 [Coccomyxa subellipsoidea C-169]EIE26826.1 hypothetical protein COCSUDRAFT_64673 [Coccomyxa subellipsoidea C-169]|eukprot:XP_005651370.1 hypothetical protein COCSUDRAFT_64673 [Coccomyxa subellipsoidea C-169]